jgi:hypothetical protein
MDKLVLFTGENKPLVLPGNGPVAQTDRGPATILSHVLRCPSSIPVGCGEIQVNVSYFNFGPPTIPPLYRALILILILVYRRLFCQVNSLHARYATEPHWFVTKCLDTSDWN